MYSLKEKTVLGLYNENVECGHLVCNEPSTLRLSNIFVDSSSYVFQMKVKSNVMSKITVLIGNQQKEILSSTSWKCSVLKFEEVTNTQQSVTNVVGNLQQFQSDSSILIPNFLQCSFLLVTTFSIKERRLYIPPSHVNE